jgi:hypothetical protein
MLHSEGFFAALVATRGTLRDTVCSNRSVKPPAAAGNMRRTAGRDGRVRQQLVSVRTHSGKAPNYSKDLKFAETKTLAGVANEACPNCQWFGDQSPYDFYYKTPGPTRNNRKRKRAAAIDSTPVESEASTNDDAETDSAARLARAQPPLERVIKGYVYPTSVRLTWAKQACTHSKPPIFRL